MIRFGIHDERGLQIGTLITRVLFCILSVLLPVEAVPGQTPEGKSATGTSRETLEKTLESLNKVARSRLIDIVLHKDFRGKIPAIDIDALVAAEKTSVDDLLVKLLPLAKLYSSPPLSHYRVGVVCRGFSGSAYLGANLEVPGQALFFSVHGEQSAITNAYLHGESGVSALAVTAAPCGHCRQFLYEMHNSSDLRILIAGSKSITLNSLLPMPFSPKDLGLSSALFKSEEFNLELKDKSEDPLVLRALLAARKSYSPYTKSPSGVAVRTKRGSVYAGSYIENVAFNPSLPPLEAACVSVVFGSEELDEITGVVLVECENAGISQEKATFVVSGQMAPLATVKRVVARMHEM